MAIDHEPVVPAAMTEPAAPPGAPRVAIGDAYRRLVFGAGLRPREAASLLAWLEGLPMVAGGWTLTEVERLLFVRVLVAAGRVGS